MTIPQLIEDIDNINIAKGLDKDYLDTLGHDVYSGYDTDLSDPKRMEWAKNIDTYIDYAMQVTIEKSDPWEGAANIKLPTLTEAAIQFNARALPALVPSNNIVTCTTNGEDSDGGKTDRAKRVGKHMTYQLKEEMEEWECDQDKLLIILPIAGCCFKKTYQDAELDRPVSKLVRPTNLIVKYDAPSLDRAPRLSEVVEFYPREVDGKQRSGEWIGKDIVYEDEDKQALEKFITQHTYLDIRNLGFLVPYIVTIHEKSKQVMRIVANYTEDDIYYNDGEGIVNVRQVKQDIDNQNEIISTGNIDAAALAVNSGSEEAPIQLKEEDYPEFKKYKVIRVTSTKYYTKYSFLPSPEGSIYDMGLGQLLRPLLDAGDTLVNQMLDAGSASNLQGGLMAMGVKTPSKTSRVNVTQWTKVQTNGRSIRDSMLPFNFRGPSATAFNLLSFLLESAKSIANLKDILAGEAPQGETATTSMIKREEGMRIYNAIYKRVYRAQKREFQLIYDLNSIYLSEKKYFNILDTREAIHKKDYSFDKTDVRPTADPSESMPSQKIIKAEALMQFVGDPEANSYNIKKNYLEAIEISNIDDYLPPPSDKPTPPDPLLVKTTAEVGLTEAKTASEQAKAENLKEDTIKKRTESIKNIADAESKELGPQLEMYKQEVATIHKKGELNEQRRAEESRNTGVETAPGNKEGIPVP
jgi:chaperonin GroES